METYYRAKRKLLIPNGPGQVPSSTRVEDGEIFSLDGTEPIDAHLLLRQRVIEPYDGPVPTRSPQPAEEPAPRKRRPALRGKKQ